MQLTITVQGCCPKQYHMHIRELEVVGEVKGTTYNLHREVWIALASTKNLLKEYLWHENAVKMSKYFFLSMFTFAN